jgi:hypothetical protein
LLYGSAFQVKPSQTVLRAQMPIVSRLPVPVKGFRVVPRNAATSLVAQAGLELRLTVAVGCVVESLLELARGLGRWIQGFSAGASRLSRAPGTQDQNYPQGSDVDCHHPTPDTSYCDIQYCYQYSGSNGKLRQVVSGFLFGQGAP